MFGSPTRRQFLSQVAAGITAFAGIGSVAFAQLPRGGEFRLPPVSTAEEQLSQADLWVLDVYFKPMRMISYERTDPITKEKKLEHAWYIVYRAFNHKLETKG